MSITQKVTLVVSLLAGLLMLGAGYAHMILQEEQTLDQARRDGRLMGEMLRAAAEAALEAHGHLEHLTALASRKIPAAAAFFDAKGLRIAPPPEGEPRVNPRMRRVVVSRRSEEDVLYDEREQATVYIYRTPLTHQGRAVGALAFSLRLESQLSPGPGSLVLAIAGALLLLFALLVGFFSQRSIGRPIDQLMVGMDEVIHGDLTATLPLDRSDEVGRIAYRFNEMTARLRAAQDEVRRGGEAKLQLEQRLRQSEKLATVGQLSAEIAHEVGTPLNVIGGRARVLERKLDNPEEIRKNAQIIADQASRITKIIQRLLDLTRARTVQRADVALHHAVDDALAFLEYQLEQAQITVVRRFADDLPAVFADADGLQQVILNLLLNAIQAMPSGGTLEITIELVHRRKGGLDLAPPEPYVAVSIRDSGEGITPERRSHIFEPFYSTKDQGEGTGLGLTVVAGIVKEHDGWIDVEPAEPAGTVFRLYLPTNQAVDTRPGESSAHADPAGPESPQRTEPASAEPQPEAPDTQSADQRADDPPRTAPAPEQPHKLGTDPARESAEEHR